MADFLDNIGDGLAAIAPSIASAFGGPLAGLAVTQVEKWLGVDPGASKADPKGFQAAFQNAMASPEQVVALKKLDTEFKQFCLDNDLQLERVAAADRDSARNRQVQVKDRMPNVALVMTTFGFFGMLALMMAYDVPPQNKDMINIMLGSLGTGWMACLTYFVGSTRSNKAKDDTIAGLSRPPS